MAGVGSLVVPPHRPTARHRMPLREGVGHDHACTSRQLSNPPIRSTLDTTRVPPCACGIEVGDATGDSAGDAAILTVLDCGGEQGQWEEAHGGRRHTAERD